MCHGISEIQDTSASVLAPAGTSLATSLLLSTEMVTARGNSGLFRVGHRQVSKKFMSTKPDPVVVQLSYCILGVIFIAVPDDQ